MYIPTMFFGGIDNCPVCEFSGGVVPPNVEIGRLDSGSDTYFYIEVPAGSSVSFSFDSGVADATLLLVGGGGATTGQPPNWKGGASSGDVVYQTIRITPDEYFLSSSAFGASNYANQGGPSVFVKKNNSTDVVNWTTYTAYGGIGMNDDSGGNNTDYQGGKGTSGGEAGGGGAGSRGTGSDGYLDPVIANKYWGGDGGAAFNVPAWMNPAVGYSEIAGGGGGQGGTLGNEGANIANSAWGSGGGYLSLGQTQGGRPGRAYFFLNTSGCISGSLQNNRFFYAEGGTIGTFVSGGIQYKYHYFKTTGINDFIVRRGVSFEGKVLVIGGGAGSSTYTVKESGDAIQKGGGAGAGGLRVQENVQLFAYNQARVGNGGGPFTNGTGSLFQSLYNFATSVETVGGGAGSGIKPAGGTINAQDGGSGGGGYYFVDVTGGSGTSGEGNKGGNGFSGSFNIRRHSGGGGGGAGSAGFNATGSEYFSGTYTNGSGKGGSGWKMQGFWSFLTSSVFTGNNYLAIGGTGSAGWFDSPGTGPLPTAPLSPNGSQQWDGSGADPVDNGGGNNGIIVVVYPISGSVSNSAV